jgi:hypothetical protein
MVVAKTLYRCLYELSPQARLEFGKYVKGECESEGIRQGELAKIAACGVRTIRRFYDGGASIAISVRVVNAASELLNKKACDLLETYKGLTKPEIDRLKKKIKVCANSQCNAPWRCRGRPNTTVEPRDGVGEPTCSCGWHGMALWQEA